MSAPKIGDRAECSECRKPGVVVAADGKHDLGLECESDLPLEPSRYREGLTCKGCELILFRSALPSRGSCGWCGAPNAKALHHDLGATRSFCNDQCISNFLTNEERLVTDRRRHAAVIGRALAVALFRDMADPERRGPDATWEQLPDMASRRAVDEGHTHAPFRFDQSHRDIASAAARDEMISLQAAGRPASWS